jgi:hypothetical protein
VSSDDPLIRELGEANPVPLARVEGLAESPEARDLLNKVMRKRAALHPWRPRLMVWLALAAAMVVVAILAIDSPKNGEPSAEEQSAEEVLLAVAAVAESASPAKDEGRFQYRRALVTELSTFVTTGNTWSVMLPSLEESWIAPDGSGRLRSVMQSPVFPGERDRQGWETAGSPEFDTGVSDLTFPKGALTFESFLQVPTAPEAVLNLLLDQVDGDEIPEAVALFIRIGELLSEAGATPQQRAALYRAASSLPGIELLGETKDRIGRSGVGVGINFRSSGTKITTIMIFDPGTTDLLAQEDILQERASWIDAPPGSVVSYTVYLNSGRVGSTAD